MTTFQTHTIDEALAKFDLIQGKGDGTKTACVMSAISWVAGEAFTDAPSCSHRVLRSIAIAANDAEGTTPEDRAAILKAGEHGLIDTWWIPDSVVMVAMSSWTRVAGEEPPKDERSKVQVVLDTLGAITWWKADKQPAVLSSAVLSYADLCSADLRSADLSSADLRYADLRYADLRSAVLSSADLSSADLRYADLRYADLRSAVLSSADLSSADLRYADLRSAVLSSADLSYADLRYADLSSADLRSADLRYADLRSARNLDQALAITTARGNQFTKLPAGWSIDEKTGLVVKASEVQA